MEKIPYKDIEQIIPHRYPVIMIDQYRKVDSNTAWSNKQFTPDSYGCENGWVLESILIEACAQTVAAHFGYQGLEDETGEIGSGMLTSVDEFVFHEMVKDDSEIDVRIVKTNEVGPFKLIACEIRVKDKLVANGRIKIFNS